MKVTSLPDDLRFEVASGETLLEAGLRAGVAFAHACGDRAKCSTCRIGVVDGPGGCHERNELESAMAERLGFSPEMRLTCQRRPHVDLSVRRLVLDETDLAMCSQLDRAVATRAGEEKVEIADHVRVRLRGTRERITLYEVSALTPAAQAALAPPERDSVFFAGKRWLQVLAIDELAPREWRIVEVEDVDVVVTRLTDETYHAFNCACPHLHLPLFERRDLEEGAIGINTDTRLPRPLCSDFTGDRGLICRWHQSCFDLQAGEIRDWAPVLDDDGTTTGWEFLGDVSRNRGQLEVYQYRVSDGFSWLAME